MPEVQDRSRLIAAVIGWVALSAYVASTFLPVGPSSPTLDLAGAPLLERLFPGVPGIWVMSRLCLLLGGAASLAWSLESPPPLRWTSSARGMTSGSRLAAGIAFILAAGAWLADDFPRVLQLVFVLALSLPALVLALSARARPTAHHVETWSAAVTLGVVAGWSVVRGVTGWHSTRMADPLDTWLGFARLESALVDGRNVLTSHAFPGQTEGFLLPQGLALVDLGIAPLSVGLVQLTSLGALALAALGVALLAARWIGPASAPVAAAVLLFAPFTLLLPLQLTAFAFAAPLAVGLLLALDAVVRRASAPGLVALALLVGLAPWQPAVVPLAGLAAVIAFLHSRQRIAALDRVTAALVLTAALVPGLLKGLPSLHEARAAYGGGRVAWAAVEWVMLGQHPLRAMVEFQESGISRPLDLVLGSLLAPFAIPRTPLRLLGDVLFDPLGAALAAVGVCICIRVARHRPLARLLLAALAATLVTGVISSYDRVSLTRIGAAPVPIALLAALGFQTLTTRVRRRALVAIAATAAIAASGSVIFDVVSPSLLPRSWLGIALARLEASPPPGGAALLRYAAPAPISWLHIERIARHLPERPVPVAAHAHASRADLGAALPDVVLFSPGLDAGVGLSERICRAFPGASLFTLRDRSGIGACRAAVLRGSWDPGLPPERSSRRECAADVTGGSGVP